MILARRVCLCADPEYAGIYLHARYFDPKLGIFLSPDPIGVEGGMNLYAYALGNPVNGTDRSGLLLDQCYDDPDCKIRVYGPGLDGRQASNPLGPGVSFFATGRGTAAAGAAGGLLVFLVDKLAGPIGRFFGGHSNNAPRDPSVPPSTAYVPGKHIDPYSDYEEPGLDSLVSLVPTAGTPTGGNGGSGGGSGGGEGGGGETPRSRSPVLIAQEMSRFPIWDQFEPFEGAREVFPNSRDVTRDRQRHCFISCIQMRSNGPLFTWWLTFESGFEFLQIPIRGSGDSSCDMGANAYGSVGAFTPQTCQRLCSTSPFNRP